MEAERKRFCFDFYNYKLDSWRIFVLSVVFELF